MNWLAWLRRRRAAAPAETARDRLKLLLAQDRLDVGVPDYLPALKREVLEVLASHITVGGEEVDVSLARAPGAMVLEVRVTIPTSQARQAAPVAYMDMEPAFAR